MVRKALLTLLLLTAAIAPATLSQVRQFTPVTTQMLEKPSPNDWLMFSRTYDAQRFSPLDQIKKSNVGQLKLAWSKDMATGAQESIPLVHDGILYTLSTGPAGGSVAIRTARSIVELSSSAEEIRSAHFTQLRSKSGEPPRSVKSCSH